MNMHQTLSALERNTHKFVQEHSNLSNKVEYLKYKSYVEQRNHSRSDSGELFFSSPLNIQTMKKRLMDSFWVLFKFIRQLKCVSLLRTLWHLKKIRDIIRTTLEWNCGKHYHNSKKKRTISSASTTSWQIGSNIYGTKTSWNNATSMWTTENESHENHT